MENKSNKAKRGSFLRNQRKQKEKNRMDIDDDQTTKDNKNNHNDQKLRESNKTIQKVSIEPDPIKKKQKTYSSRRSRRKPFAVDGHKDNDHEQLTKQKRLSSSKNSKSFKLTRNNKRSYSMMNDEGSSESNLISNSRKRKKRRINSDTIQIKGRRKRRLGSTKIQTLL